MLKNRGYYISGRRHVSKTIWKRNENSLKTQLTEKEKRKERKKERKGK